jgi:hypothetical protein
MVLKFLKNNPKLLKPISNKEISKNYYFYYYNNLVKPTSQHVLLDLKKKLVNKIYMGGFNYFSKNLKHYLFYKNILSIFINFIF